MFASLNGHRVTKGHVVVPLNGCITASVSLDEAVELSGPVILVVGDLTIKAAVVRGGPFTGSSSFQLIGGAGGWMKTIGPKAYDQPFGVKLSAVLTDAAREVGETVSISSDRTLGTRWARQKAPAAWLLQRLADQWWIREDGVTIVGPRATPTITSAFDVVKAKPEQGVVLVATEFPSVWLPGAKFSSPTMSGQISAVVHKINATQIRTEVWTSG
jgi:hypothetical protein